MGIYFIAAGSSTRNREKTLDRGFEVGQLTPLLPPAVADRLRALYSNGGKVFLWGATRPDHERMLHDAEPNEYVVDVKNKEIVQVFQYGFYYKAPHERLQEFVGWDGDKPRQDRRYYKYVFFLHSPIESQRGSKRFFQEAFDLLSNPQWLVGQRRFNDAEVERALRRTRCRSAEELLGISSGTYKAPFIARPTIPALPAPFERAPSPQDQRNDTKIPTVAPPEWLQPVIKRVRHLQADAEHQERDHEAAVEHFFMTLGYDPGREIRFRRGYLDLVLCHNDTPLAVVEVKRDWALSRASSDAINQAHRYALEQGIPYVVVTNGDVYLVYDRRKGLSLIDMLNGEVHLTDLTQEGLTLIESLRRGALSADHGTPR